jgi:hypothetical protein
MPGLSINLDCNKPTATYAPFLGFKSPVTDALLFIHLRYDIDVNLIVEHYFWKRYPAPTIVRWSPNSTYSQWIRGRAASE